MADRLTATYLPRALADEVDRELDNDRESDRSFRFQRLAERIFAEGYDAGHRAGDHEARMDYSRTRDAKTQTGGTE